jgi:hypothetical protein
MPEPSRVDDLPWCSGAVVGVAALHGRLSFLRALQITNVGTEPVSGAFAVLTSYDPTFAVVWSTQTLVVPTLQPGQSHVTQEFTGINGSVAFVYADSERNDAGRSGTFELEDAGGATTLDSALTEPNFDAARCERVQLPFQFRIPHERPVL